MRVPPYRNPIYLCSTKEVDQESLCLKTDKKKKKDSDYDVRTYLFNDKKKNIYTDPLQAITICPSNHL